MSSDLIFATDLGTSGPKVGLVDITGKVLDTDFEPVDLYLLPGGGAEQDPRQWWSALGIASRRLMERNSGATVVGVGTTAQWSGTVAVDEHGDPLGNAIIWMDSRGASLLAERIGGAVSFEGYSLRKLWRWIRLTGGAPGRAGKDPIAHILWLEAADPERYRETTTFLEPKDYLNLRMTGVPAASYDSMTLHWVTDNRRLDAVDYHPRLLRLAGLPREKLPPLLQATDVVGTLQAGAAGHLGLPAGIPVAAGTADLQSAGIGSGCVTDFAAHLYVGTSAWINTHVPFKKTDLLHSLAALPSPLPGRYFLANEQETAGACLDYLGAVFFPDWAGPDNDLYRHLDEIAAEAPAGAGGVIFTPWLLGERTPVEDSTLRAAFLNQSLNTTREHLVRAVFEGVAMNARWLLQYVERFCKRPLGGLTFVGGGARSDVWCQVFADVLNRPIRQVADPSSVNLRGAALLASLALERIDLEGVAAAVPIKATYRPNAAHRDVFDRGFEAFIDAHKATRGISRRLNVS